MAFMPENAPLAVLTLAFVASLLTAGGVGLAWAYSRKRGRAMMRILEGMGVVGILYGTALVTFSLTSQEKILTRGQWKYFCEVDCHLAYSVQEVTTSSRLGEGGHPRQAQGIFYRVKMRTWFDETTITPGRGNAPLRPEPRSVAVVDAEGRSYLPIRIDGEGRASRMGLPEPSRHPLRPGESTTFDLVFDLPSDILEPLLLVTNRPGLDTLILGHEQSPFHKKIFFEMKPSETSANG